MRKLIRKLINNKGAKRVFALALAFVFMAGLCGEFFYIPSTWAFADEEEGATPTIGNAYYYKWHLCQSNDEMEAIIKKGDTDPDKYQGFHNRVLILYGGSPDNPKYRVSGATYGNGDHEGFRGVRIEAGDGIEANKSEFITLSNFNTPFIKRAKPDVKNNRAFILRFMPSYTNTAFDIKYEFPDTDKGVKKNKDGTYPDGYIYGQMTNEALNQSMLYTYSCLQLWGGTQSASFYPKLVKTKFADMDDSFWYDGERREEQLVLFFGGKDSKADGTPDGTAICFTYRKWLIDSIWEPDGSLVDMEYITNYHAEKDDWFKFYVSTLVEKPAIVEDMDIYGYTSTLIDSTLIKAGVTIVVRDGAVLRLSGKVTNLGQIYIADGGTLILDYDASISTELTAVKQGVSNDGVFHTWTDTTSNTTFADIQCGPYHTAVDHFSTVYPGCIKVLSGGQFIALDGSTVNLPYIKDQTSSFEVKQGGSFYLAGDFYCGNNALIRGEMYITSMASVHTGYYLSGTTKMEAQGAIYFYDNCLLVMEPRDKGRDEQDVSGESCAGIYWSSNDMNHYQKWGGVYYNYGDNNSLLFHPGITQETIDPGSAGQGDSYYIDTKSGDTEYEATEIICYDMECVEQFFDGRLKNLLDRYDSNTNIDDVYINTGTGQIGSSYAEVGVSETAVSQDQAALDSLNKRLKGAQARQFYYESSYTCQTDFTLWELDCDGNRGSGC